MKLSPSPTNQPKPLPGRAECYAAFVRRDSTYEGIFWVGVRTTGIFCRPTCPARKAKLENTEFFANCADALAAGYRACERCHPLTLVGSPPAWIAPLLKAIEADPSRRWTTEDLRAIGLEPARVRRWFTATYGMTLIAYTRAQRLGRAFSRLQSGAPVLETALAADYDSLSGFCAAMDKAAGGVRRSRQPGLTLHVRQFSSPLGPLVAAATDSTVYLLEFTDRRRIEEQFTTLARHLDAVWFPGESPALRALEGELAAYFEGKRRTFSVPLAFPGTPFQETVWEALCAVPYGETRTYGQLAAACGKASAVRAVARVVGENRLAILLPCHRIIGANGDLTGYAGGLWRKRQLLAQESPIAEPLAPGAFSAS